jgi:formate/nitrite transporter
MEQETDQQYLPPHKIAGPFAASAVKKARMSFQQFSIYAFLGGVFIASGGLLSILVAGGMPGMAASNPGIVKFMAGAMFPLGLVLVVVAGAGLFTSDCATLPFAFWQKKISFKQVLQVGFVGYIANFAGAVLVAWLFAYQTGTLTKDPWREYAVNLAVHKTEAGFWVVFAKGIGANLMVCLAVWMASAAKDITGKVLLIWMPVMAFVALGWEHSIANMFFIPLGMLLDAPVSMVAFLWNNLLPATLGNIAGGMLLVALPYYLVWGKSLPDDQNNKINDLKRENMISDKPAIESGLFTHLN